MDGKREFAARVTEGVEEPGRQDETLAGDRSEQVLVGGVLKTAGVRVRQPQRRQSEDLREHRVREGAADIGQYRHGRRGSAAGSYRARRPRSAARTPM